MVEIDLGSVRTFFEKREERVQSGHPLTSVLYQDAAPELAAKRDAAEKLRLIPHLALTADSVVLDVACGIGRWALPVVSRGARYIGVDFSPRMLQAGRDSAITERATFIDADVTTTPLSEVGLPEAPDRILICGLLMYLNDANVRELGKQIAAVAMPDSRILLREPIGVKHRFTLNNCKSDELCSTYSAVYRTRTELLHCFASPLKESGFELIEDGWLYEGLLNNRTETRQRYFVWGRP